MTNTEKISILEEMMELPSGSLKEETKLENVAEWDSMAALSFVAVLDEKFGKNITSDQVNKLKTIEEMIALMN